MGWKKSLYIIISTSEREKSKLNRMKWSQKEIVKRNRETKEDIKKKEKNNKAKEIKSN